VVQIRHATLSPIATTANQENRRAPNVVRYIPKAGSVATQSFDAETCLLLRTVMKIDAPEAGGEIEQTGDLSDYREVDGVKVPFTVKVVNPVQSLTITLTKVEHNKLIDDAMFSKPAAK
jgi:hypothetical protein